MRTLHLKIEVLQEQLESARAGRLELLQRDDQLMQEVGQHRKERERLAAELTELRARPVVDEKSIRDALEVEWSEKLQTIVTQVSDHEADVGKAIEERETARAEPRKTAKLSRCSRN
jgi:uncharacterized coiled-coil DUF342 family protein